ncbi:dehydrogenase [Limtongia smithiae]|uniref:dehydrogenase n=1 Tax=Limtongia smithiae TaxID=1125753 RepID=UPI0034CDEDAF
MSLKHHKSSVDSALAGVYVASPVKFMIYGRGTSKDMKSLMARMGVSKAFIITGQSLSLRTPVVKDIECALADAHVGTYNKIGQHAPISAIQEATALVKQSGADVMISVGGGSPIDSAKAIAYLIHQDAGVWIPSIAVPTTLSVAETTQNAGYTTEEKKKLAVSHPELVPKAVVYDGDLALYTPTNLWTSTGIRSLDHAVELLYHPLACEVPTKRLALEAIKDLFTYLPLSKADPADADARQKLFLACYASLFPFLYTGGVGLSHSLGHSLGATYNIPHGITSCLTLAPVIKFKATNNPDEAVMIARAVPYVGKTSTGDPAKDSLIVSEAIKELVHTLGHSSTLTQYNVPPGDAEAIAEHALGGDRNHPLFETATNLVKGLY